MEVPFSEAMRPSVQVVQNPVLRSQLRQRLQRSRDLRADIKAEFAKTRRLLENSHATLERARARR
jgi:hypothetical protein